MPGKNTKFTVKQDRQAKHIIASEEKRGLSPKEAANRAYGHLQNEKKAKGKK